MTSLLSILGSCFALLFGTGRYVQEAEAAGVVLLKRTELKRGPGPKRTKRMRQVSGKKATEDREYRVFVGEMRLEWACCEVCPRLADAGIVINYTSHGFEGLHHLKKRSQGGALMDRNNVLRACNWSNGWIEDNPRRAHELGLVRRTGE